MMSRTGGGGSSQAARAAGALSSTMRPRHANARTNARAGVLLTMVARLTVPRLALPGPMAVAQGARAQAGVGRGNVPAISITGMAMSMTGAAWRQCLPRRPDRRKITGCDGSVQPGWRAGWREGNTPDDIIGA